MKKTFLRWLMKTYKKRKQASHDGGLENCLRAAATTVKRTQYAFLISHGADGFPHGRLVEPICDTRSFEVCIGTDPSLRKVREIEASPQVAVAFGNDRERANLVIYGRASIETDPAFKRRHWKGAWGMFFTGGPASDGYVVIRVVPERMELMSFRGNVVPEPFGLRPAVLVRGEEGVWRLA